MLTRVPWFYFLKDQLSKTMLSCTYYSNFACYSTMKIVFQQNRQKAELCQFNTFRSGN